MNSNAQYSMGYKLSIKSCFMFIQRITPKICPPNSRRIDSLILSLHSTPVLTDCIPLDIETWIVRRNCMWSTFAMWHGTHLHLHVYVFTANGSILLTVQCQLILDDDISLTSVVHHPRQPDTFNIIKFCHFVQPLKETYINVHPQPVFLTNISNFH